MYLLSYFLQLSQQILELFQTCQQQSDDLEKKELCRAELQREIQRLFPRMSETLVFFKPLHKLGEVHYREMPMSMSLCFSESRVYLAGSSLNGFGSRSSDADLCLVVQEGPVCVWLIQSLLFHFAGSLGVLFETLPQFIQKKFAVLFFVLCWFVSMEH